ncbi:MAG: CheY-like chemotaxis protein [Olleya marilimosa]|jgi:CheY-like chemotaxis protein
MKQIESACLIDDDHIFIFAAKKILLATDICQNFTIYNNGADAIEGLSEIIKTGKNVPDLILLDINMPIMDGWQFLDEFIKIKYPKKVTLYIVSSSIDPVDIKKAKEYEAITDFIIKPITRKNLINMVATVFEKEQD